MAQVEAPALRDEASAFTTVVEGTPTVSAEVALDPDLSETAQFLQHLDPKADKFHFQVFAERPNGPDGAFTLQGSLDAVAPRLIKLNRCGYGVFVTINVVMEGERRTAQNVIRVRAVFADSDDGARTLEVGEAIGRLGLPPSIVVESSPGKRHYYWLTDDCPLEQFAVTQKHLAVALGTDPAVCDLPRVMRLPGFFHLKGRPFRTRLVHVT